MTRRILVWMLVGCFSVVILAPAICSARIASTPSHFRMSESSGHNFTASMTSVMSADNNNNNNESPVESARASKNSLRWWKVGKRWNLAVNTYPVAGGSTLFSDRIVTSTDYMDRNCGVHSGCHACHPNDCPFNIAGFESVGATASGKSRVNGGHRKGVEHVGVIPGHEFLAMVGSTIGAPSMVLVHSNHPDVTQTQVKARAQPMVEDGEDDDDDMLLYKLTPNDPLNSRFWITVLANYERMQKEEEKRREKEDDEEQAAGSSGSSGSGSSSLQGLRNEAYARRIKATMARMNEMQHVTSIHKAAAAAAAAAAAEKAEDARFLQKEGMADISSSSSSGGSGGGGRHSINATETAADEAREPGDRDRWQRYRAPLRQTGTDDCDLRGMSVVRNRRRPTSAVLLLFAPAEDDSRDFRFIIDRAGTPSSATIRIDFVRPRSLVNLLLNLLLGVLLALVLVSAFALA